MDEKKFVKLLKEHFPSKKEFLNVSKNLEDLEGTVMSLKHRLITLTMDMHEFKKEMREFRKETESAFENLEEKIKDLKPSADTLDKILEQHPIERINRLEKHNHLPIFVPILQED